MSGHGRTNPLLVGCVSLYTDGALVFGDPSHGTPADHGHLQSLWRSWQALEGARPTRGSLQRPEDYPHNGRRVSEPGAVAGLEGPREVRPRRPRRLLRRPRAAQEHPLLLPAQHREWAD